jgi:hypothetical protein
VLADTADADDVALVAAVLGDIDVDGDGFGGDIADDVAATFVVDCVEDNGADVVVVVHVRDWHVQLLVGFVEQSC